MSSELWHARIRALAPDVSPVLRVMLATVLAAEGLETDSLLFVADALEEEAVLLVFAGQPAVAAQLRALAELSRRHPPAQIRTIDCFE